MDHKILIYGYDFETLQSSPSCRFMDTDLERLKSHASGWKEEFDRLRNYIVNAGEKRLLLIDVVQEGLEALALEKLINVLGHEYDAMKDQITDALVLARISIEIDNWWFEANRNGLAERLHTRHLQYTMPLRILAGHLAQAKEYKNRLVNLGGRHPAEIVNMINEGLDSKIALINSNLDSITLQGWQGVLQQERSLALKRLDYLDRYVPECHGLIDEFLVASNEVAELEQFRNVEAKYLKVSVGCVTRK